MSAAESAKRVYSLGELRAMVSPLLIKYGLRGARLFGSYARSEATPASDIDILIDGGQNFRPLGVFALAEDLREMSGKSVDVFELSELNEGPFRNNVLREAVTL